MNSLPFFPQEHPESCVPACVRILLAHYGQAYSESEIYACCQTDFNGTLPSTVIHCLQSLGFKATAPRLSGFDALLEELTVGQIIPIVYINLAPLLGINVIHAVLVQAIDIADGEIQVIDPAYPPNGRRVFALELFEVAWKLARYQTILVQPE